MSDSSRPWTQDPRDIDDATFLVKNLEAPGRDVLRWLAHHPDQRFSSQQVADCLSPELTTPTQLVETVSNRVHLVNAHCESYGRTPLIDVGGKDCSVTASDAVIVLAALEELERWLS